MHIIEEHRNRTHQFDTLGDAISWMAKVKPDTDWTRIHSLSELNDRLPDGWRVDFRLQGERHESDN